MKKLMAVFFVAILLMSFAYAESISLRDINIKAFGASEPMPQKNPPRGSLKGGAKQPHSNLVFERGKADDHNYVFIILDEENTAIEIGFMGKKDKACMLYAPVGKYQLLVGFGDTWYGIKHLFGEEGTYYKTGQIHIEKPYLQYSVIINAKDADIPAYEINPKENLNE